MRLRKYSIKISDGENDEQKIYKEVVGLLK